MSAHSGAIFVGHTLRLINKNANDRLVIRAGHFGVHKLETVVDCDSFSQLLNPCCNRFICHGFPPSSPCPLAGVGMPPKRKSGREPTGRASVPSSKLWIIRKALCRGNLVTR